MFAIKNGVPKTNNSYREVYTYILLHYCQPMEFFFIWNLVLLCCPKFQRNQHTLLNFKNRVFYKFCITSITISFKWLINKILHTLWTIFGNGWKYSSKNLFYCSNFQFSLRWACRQCKWLIECTYHLHGMVVRYWFLVVSNKVKKYLVFRLTVSKSTNF